MKALDSELKILPKPINPNHLPNSIQWLSGEGCGSWFHIIEEDSLFIISRFSPIGELECKGKFEQMQGEKIKLKELYTFTYLSHCASVNILQNNSKLNFKLIEKC